MFDMRMRAGGMGRRIMGQTVLLMNKKEKNSIRRVVVKLQVLVLRVESVLEKCIREKLFSMRCPYFLTKDRAHGIFVNRLLDKKEVNSSTIHDRLQADHTNAWQYKEIAGPCLW